MSFHRERIQELEAEKAEMYRKLVEGNGNPFMIKQAILALNSLIKSYEEESPMITYEELISDLELRKARMMKVLGKVKELGDESSQEMLRGSLHMLDTLIEDYEQLALEEDY